MTQPAKKWLRLGPASSWLPAVALFLCLSLFAMAAMVLHGVSSDPKSPQSAVVTAVSAQGYQGLRRVLDARGVTTLTNRFEDGPNVTRGDLEVISLDLGALGFMPMVLPDADSSASESAGDSASAEASSSPLPDQPGDLDENFFPSPMRANHMLYTPLGRAVLVVAPKWQARSMAKNPRWAADPELANNPSIRDMLAELSPMTESPAKMNDDGDYIKPAPVPGRNVYFSDDLMTTYDKVPYVITRASTPTNLVLKSAKGGGEVAVGKIESLQSITAPNLVPVLVGQNGEVILSRVIVTGGRKATKVPVYLLSDPDLINNQILSDPQKVIAALKLIDGVMPAGGKSVVFNLAPNGLAFDRDLLHAMSRPPYIGIPVSVLILGLGLLWAAFARFGPARHVEVEAPLGRGVRVLADNAARLMSLTLRETRLAPAYATLMRDAALRQRSGRATQDALVGKGQGAGSLDDLAERLGQLYKTTHAFTALRREANQVTTVHQLVDLARKLHAWKTEISRAHI